MDTDVNSETRLIFIVGLRNAPAMENQALSIMKPQVQPDRKLSAGRRPAAAVHPGDRRADWPG